MEENIIDESVIITKFNPLEASLKKMASESKSITAKDFSDKDKMAIISRNRKELKNARIDLEKIGKMLRDPHTQFNRKVKEKEDELVEIIEPEEKRLKEIEDEAKRLEGIELRKQMLPIRLERLSVIGDGVNISDDDINIMDANQFESHINYRIAAKQEKERMALDAERAAIEKEKAEIARQKEIEAAKKNAVQEERERAEQAEVVRKLKEEQNKRDAEAKAIQERERAEQEAKEEQEKLDSEKKYQAFLSKHGYVDGGEFKIERTGNEVILYKKLGVYKSK